MSRNVRTYDHFCLLARALERVGDRWSLLVIRDLLTGGKRFTDLMDRLGGITPKTLTQRLRELEESGIVAADRAPGRREVWYRLTPAGAELGPAIEALSWWGLRHAWRMPNPGERLHIEHLLRATTQAIDHTSDDRAPARWRIRLADDGDYLIASDGEHWSLSTEPPARPPDPSGQPADVTVTVPGTSDAWLRFAADPSHDTAARAGIDIAGADPDVRRFLRLLRVFPDVVQSHDQHAVPHT